MKRKLKSLFRMAITLVTIGAVMVILGLLMGGAGELSKEVTELVHMVRVGVSETVERIPLLERITNISGFTVVVDKEDFSVAVNEEYETISGDYCDLKLADASEVNSLDISILNGVFRILPSENGCFGVESIEAGEYQCYVSDGTLYLSVLPTYLEEGEKAEIILYVPANQEFDKVFLFCSSEQVEIGASIKGGELNISSICGVNTFNKLLDFADVTVSVGIGSLSIDELIAEHFKLEVSTAEVSIADLDAGNMEVNLGMGKISIQGITTGDIVLNCGMGHLELLLSCEQTAYNYDISGSAESVQIGADTLAGMVMERWIDNDSDKKITMSCSMGSVKIEFEK